LWHAADRDALGPLLDAVTASTEPTPAEVSANRGDYCSKANLVDLAGRGIHGTSPPAAASLCIETRAHMGELHRKREFRTS
jgi:hypothetical protein